MSPISRRAVLRRGLWGGLLLSLGGAGWLATRGGRSIPLPASGLRVLSPREYALLHAVAERMIPAHPPAPTASEVGVAVLADRALSLADPSARTEVQQLLGLLDNALTGFLFQGTTESFTALSPEAQDRILEGWRFSAFTLKRTGYQALRTLVLAAYYCQPAVWPSIGYPGPPAGYGRRPARVDVR